MCGTELVPTYPKALILFHLIRDIITGRLSTTESTHNNASECGLCLCFVKDEGTH